MNGFVAIDYFGEDRISDSFSIDENMPVNVDETHAITTNPANDFDTISMDATYQSTFASNAFSVDALNTAHVVDPEVFGSAVDGEYYAELVVSVTFELTDAVEVEYFIGSIDNNVAFVSVDSDTEFTHFFNGAGNAAPGLSGSMFLSAGTYRMDGSAFLKGESFGFPSSGLETGSLTLSLEVVPAPASAAWLLGGGLLATRRRR